MKKLAAAAAVGLFALAACGSGNDAKPAAKTPAATTPGVSEP